MDVTITQTSNPDDITPIMVVLEDYFRESKHAHENEPYDPEMSVQYLGYMITEQHTLVAKDEDGKIIGVVLCDAGHSFWKRKELAIGTFYIVPEWRGTELGRKFIQAIKQLVIHHNYKYAAGASTSGFGPVVEKQFANMLIKEGFVGMGQACVFDNDLKEKST